MKIYLVAGITQNNYIENDSSHIEYEDADKRISELEDECNGTQWEILTIDVPQPN